MKKALLSCAVVAMAMAAHAQTNVNVTSPARTAAFIQTPDELQLLPTYITDKSENQSYYVDYGTLNTDDNYAEAGTTGYYSYFQLNTAAVVADSMFTDIAVGLKPYIGFTDYADLGNSYYEPDLGAAGGVVRIDSIFALLSHVNGSGNTNNIIISLRKGVAYTFGSDAVEGPSNTVYWSDTISSNTSLSPNGVATGDYVAQDGSFTESAFLWQAAVGNSLPVTASSLGFVIDIRTSNIGAGDTVNVVCFGRANGATPSDPYVWNTTAVRSNTPSQIGLFYASANMWAKVTYTNTVSIQNLDANGFTIHNFMPNPANESTIINFELKNSADVRFTVTDMTGKQVKTISLKNQSAGTQNYVLNTSDLAVGTYNVAMTVNGQVFSQKLNVVK